MERKTRFYDYYNLFQLLLLWIRDGLILLLPARIRIVAIVHVFGYLSMVNLKESIHSKTADFLTLCKTHNVKTLYAFGSSVTQDFNDESSDIDLLIEVSNTDPIERGETLLKIWDRLEQFFQRKVDLLTSSSVKNPVLKKSIEATKVLIYDGKEQKVSI